MACLHKEGTGLCVLIKDPVLWTLYLTLCVSEPLTVIYLSCEYFYTHQSTWVFRPSRIPDSR